MVSLSVFKIKSGIDKFIKSNKISLMSEIPKQKDLGAYDINMKEKLTQGTTEIEFLEEKEGYRTYKVHQETNTQNDLIKVYKWEIIEEFIGEEDIQNRIKGLSTNSIMLKRGYQVVSDFRIILDKKENLLYVFAKKDEGTLLQKRLIKNGILEIAPFELDLSKIKLVPEILDEWCAWLDDTGQLVKKAIFGANIKKYTEGEEEYVTSYKVTYNHEDIEIDLSISREGRISTNNRSVTGKALLKIFNSLKEKITKEDISNII
jgi:hypothetical protein